MSGARRYLNDEGGAGAAEFALVVLPFMALIFAIIYLSLLVYFNSQLQYATEATARWASVTSSASGSDPSAGQVQAHFNSVYGGPTLASGDPTYSHVSCGHRVVANTTFGMNVVVTSVSVPLTASACYP